MLPLLPNKQISLNLPGNANKVTRPFEPNGQINAEIGKAKQAYGPMAPGLQKLWAISKKYGPWQ